MFRTNPPNGHLLGDSGYGLTNYLLVPFKDGQGELPAEIRYQTAHITTRNLIERFFGCWKAKFACLGPRGLTVFDHKDQMNIITAVGYLWNILLDNNEVHTITAQPAVNFFDEVEPAIDIGDQATKRTALIQQHFANLIN